MSLVTTQAEMPALTAGDLQGVVGLQWSPRIRERAVRVPENVCPQRSEGCCRSVRLPLTLGEGDGT
jgi:hypothetical protein